MIYWLEQIQPSQILQVGDKAFALSQLIQKNYPVIKGFVISASCYRQFFQQLDREQKTALDLSFFPNLNTEDYKTLQNFSTETRQLIFDTTLPSDLANNIFQSASELQSSHIILRPSLSFTDKPKVDFSGLIPSVVCLVNTTSLEKALKQIWAELFRAKNIFYCQGNKLTPQQINFAVLVQPIKEAIASGTIEIGVSEFQIKATWGLGNSLVNGEVSPDIYLYKRQDLTEVENKIGNKTLAYGLKPFQETIESYILQEQQQQQYCLEQSRISELATLTENILTDHPQLNLLEWTLISTEGIYINQANSNFNYSITPNFKDLKGIPASPGKALGSAHVIQGTSKHLQNIPRGSIVVIKTVTPDWYPLLKKASGLITEIGGITSHGAIIARELQIPAIAGVTNATKVLKTGESILVNGNTGSIYPIFSKPIINDEQSPESQELTMKPHPIGTKLMVNISQVSSLDKAANLPVDGIGLLRGEFMLLNLAEHLLELSNTSQKTFLQENLVGLITKFAAAFAPRPIFYRSSDPAEIPALFPHSHKGTYDYLINPILFDIELEALAQISNSGYDNLRLILPYVRSVAEFVFCRHKVEQTSLKHNPNFQIWIMAEVPSVIFLLSEYVKAGVQGIAIGSNDLTQLVLGSDRHRTLPGLNATHPAMLQVLQSLIQSAKKEGISCSICGQATVDYPEIIDHLIKAGVDIISVEPEAVEKTYENIARAETRILLEVARKA